MAIDKEASFLSQSSSSTFYFTIGVFFFRNHHKYRIISQIFKEIDIHLPAAVG